VGVIFLAKIICGKFWKKMVKNGKVFVPLHPSVKVEI
jgi:hypothetical protein